MTAPDPHGTLGAYLRHLRNGAQPCGPCEAAYALSVELERQARLAETWRRLLDLIAAECRRAGLLP